ncbi:MAG: hypothetical protein ACRC33_14155, partial [Gemmataceae bacterium]
MLRFQIEWEDEPRVRDPLLRETWARLEIHAGQGGEAACLTECVAVKSHSLRRGVYGSAMPLARWVVQNWWSLLFESVRVERFPGGRRLAADPRLKPWVQRHCLLAGRGGFALPDVTVYRDGGRVVVRSVPDPFAAETPYPVRFVGDLEIKLRPEEASDGLRGLVEAVADRVRDRAPAHPEAAEFLADWEAVKESARYESLVC